ncbi:MAG: DsbA family protein [Betaproteobacteria bacterium]
MSIKSWLMPAISERILSRDRLLKRRERTERERRAHGLAHELHYFHQVDDPYSALLAAQLPGLLGRYEVALLPHVVGPPSDAAAPERDRLSNYSRKDAQRLARRFSLDYTDPCAAPSAQAVQRATRLLVGAITAGNFVETAGTVCACLWQNEERLAGREADPDEVATHLMAANSLRQRWGHYLGATLYYGGEWYWGIDRLHHLERRLQDLGAARPGVADLMFPPDVELQQAAAVAQAPGIDFFLSLRSPYTAIVAARVFQLGRLSGAPVRLRYLLPMVMRGLPVPAAKRAYISHDAAREAFARAIPFGRINDPVGRPTERGLALLALAEREGLGEAFLLSFLRGVWAEGIDAGSERGLRKIAERAGLHWEQAQAALKDESWRSSAEENRVAMFDLGLWGVPSFRVRDTVVWGQDRLWAVQNELLKPGDSASRAT